jgi:hypothetical protein
MAMHMNYFHTTMLWLTWQFYLQRARRFWQKTCSTFVFPSNMMSGGLHIVCSIYSTSLWLFSNNEITTKNKNFSVLRTLITFSLTVVEPYILAILWNNWPFIRCLVFSAYKLRAIIVDYINSFYKTLKNGTDKEIEISQIFQNQYFLLRYRFPLFSAL